MKKSLLERAMAYKKLSDSFSNTAKTQNLDIKISERPKNIKESDDSLLKNY